MPVHAEQNALGSAAQGKVQRERPGRSKDVGNNAAVASATGAAT